MKTHLFTYLLHAIQTKLVVLKKLYGVKSLKTIIHFIKVVVNLGMKFLLKKI
ncbi:hypothetical protein [Tenacibaculum ovolyticum]|uniref:hypothetical protein n=1 Tax=Tenacibaculum ovolyticum TaxID=104270 RepID=UPI0012DD0404|nr:hypothetical protein [Tenacibaculum ovolyticum]